MSKRDIDLNDEEKENRVVNRIYSINDGRYLFKKDYVYKKEYNELVKVEKLKPINLTKNYKKDTYELDVRTAKVSLKKLEIKSSKLFGLIKTTKSVYTYDDIKQNKSNSNIYFTR